MKKVIIVGAGLAAGTYYVMTRRGEISGSVSPADDSKYRLVFVGFVVLSIIIAYRWG